MIPTRRTESLPPLSAAWRKSSYSGGDNECVEVAINVKAAVPVRDSKDKAGPALVFTPAAWQAFVAGIRTGDFPT